MFLLSMSNFNMGNFSVEIFVMCRRFSESSDRGWFRSLFVQQVDARKDAHSNLLSKKETSNLYKIQCKNLNLFIHSQTKAFMSGGLRGCVLGAILED